MPHGDPNLLSPHCAGDAQSSPGRVLEAIYLQGLVLVVVAVSLFLHAEIPQSQYIIEVTIPLFSGGKRGFLVVKEVGR